ncbi:MAG: excinuclease ABC subunit UvrC [Clostridiales bacterium]|nr:excinuclease ABC subunit UvrC [Clostridiales bacterium]
MMGLDEKLGLLPSSPGVYIMKDKEGDVIYVGKAISLKNRVRQYFQSSRSHSQKVRSMVQNIEDFEYIITDSELEALILESNLIKKYRPKYNVLLKDDKHYPYIKVTVNERYPRVILVRAIERDGGRYFGPYTSSKAVKDTIEVIRNIFPIRDCSRNLEGDFKPQRPCLHYYIGDCIAPCLGNVDEGEYNEMIDKICDFLDGKHQGLLDDLKKEMKLASNALEFEKAASIRDKIMAVEKVLESQKIIWTDDMIDRDVIAFAKGKSNIIAQTFFIRQGKLNGSEHFVLEDSFGNDMTNVAESFIKQFYAKDCYIPKEIFLDRDIEDLNIIESWLTEKRGNRVYIRVPKRGEKSRLVDMAAKNAKEAAQTMVARTKRKEERTVGACIELADYLKLDSTPYRIEGFDISNMQGVESVGSMVVFEGGEAKRSDYRRFRIKTVLGPDDYASMTEVIGRRYKRALKEIQGIELGERDKESGKFSKLPELILIDGGKGQLKAAASVLDGLGLGDIPIISLAEKNEEIYVVGESDPIVLPRNSNALHLLQRIRDEAHRFALSYHRSLRKKNTLHSSLEDIPLIGPKRRIALLREFGSIEKIKSASLEELCSVKGMNKQAANKIKEYLQ